jgi:hypothetical protein
MRAIKRWRGNAALLALAAAVVLIGCGTPGAPLPPSLKLPDPVTNLTAIRTGNQVTLDWTMPRKNTDKLLTKGNIPVRVCQKEGTGICETVAAGNLSFAPGAKATFTETLPSALATGAPRPLTYFVEPLSPHGRSAGPSNAAHVLAGEAPAPVAGLTWLLQKGGVVLTWNADRVAEHATVIRLHRKLLAPPQAAAKISSQPGFLAPTKEPLDQSLLVDSPAEPGRAIDKTIRFGQTYEYRAQRITRLTIDGQTVELAGPLSEPIRVEAIDTFPPAVPTGLAAVATAANSTTGASIDLSWLPITETDLAGYAVYRREGSGEWQRISPPQPFIGPAFHDAQVQPGHTYRYAVTAVDQLGHESARSVEAEETVPNP